MKSHVKLLIFCFLLFIVLTFTGCLSKLIPTTPSITSPADTEGILYLDPANCNPTLGKDFEMELKVSSIEDLKGYSVVLSYDPAVLKLVEIAEGPCLSEGNETFFWKKIDPAKGTIQIDCAILGTEISAYGEGSLATLYFTALLTKGDTGVNFAQTQIRDIHNQPILATQKSARIRCK